MTTIYDEVLKMNSFELYHQRPNEEYYSIPLNFDELNNILNLLHQQKNYQTLKNVLLYLKEEYNLDFSDSYVIE